MKKRLWSAILALCIVLTMTPITAFATDGESPNTNITLDSQTLSDTLTVEDGAIITLIGENTGTKIYAKGDVTITSENGGSYSGTEIEAKGKITINGNAVVSINKSGHNAINGKTGVEILGDAQVTSNATGQGAIRSTDGAVTINSSKEVRLTAGNGGVMDAAIYTGTSSSTDKTNTSTIKSKVVVTGGGTAFTSYNGDIVIDGGQLDVTN